MGILQEWSYSIEDIRTKAELSENYIAGGESPHVHDDSNYEGNLTNYKDIKLRKGCILKRLGIRLREGLLILGLNRSVQRQVLLIEV